MGAAESLDSPAAAAETSDIASLMPMVRRVVASRIGDPHTAEDLVQETLARVLSAVDRVEPGLLESYAIVTARHAVASHWREQERRERHLHRLADEPISAEPDSELLRDEERGAVAQALQRLSARDRHALVAHEIEGQDTRELAAEWGSTAGAVAAQLHRSRARLRVEYLLARERAELPSEGCKPVLLALSGGDRRRQRDVGAGQHLLECPFCAELSQPLLARSRFDDGSIRILIRADADIVRARQAAREAAARLGFRSTDLTVIATAVSEIARNIVRFADLGEILIEELDEPRRGLRVIAHDRGPGIRDVEEALSDGYSTYDGLGLGLPGARRLMDEFAIVSEIDRGTTVSMTKWAEG